MATRFLRCGRVDQRSQAGSCRRLVTNKVNNNSRSARAQIALRL
jgi:hypothetical protein